MLQNVPFNARALPPRIHFDPRVLTEQRVQLQEQEQWEQREEEAQAEEAQEQEEQLYAQALQEQEEARLQCTQREFFCTGDFFLFWGRDGLGKGNLSYHPGQFDCTHL